MSKPFKPVAIRRPSGFERFIKQQGFHGIYLITTEHDSPVKVEITEDPVSRFNHLQAANFVLLRFHRFWGLPGRPVSKKIEAEFKSHFEPQHPWRVVRHAVRRSRSVYRGLRSAHRHLGDQAGAHARTHGGSRTTPVLPPAGSPLAADRSNTSARARLPGWEADCANQQGATLMAQASCSARRDLLLDATAHGPVGDVEIIAGLQVDPELRRRAEVSREAQRRVGGDRAPRRARCR